MGNTDPRAPASIMLLRLLPSETAHAIGIWAIRTGVWRLALMIDAACTLAWAIPATWLLRWCERQGRA